MISPQIKRDGRTTYLGAFRDRSEACAALSGAPAWLATVVEELRECAETRFEAGAFMDSVADACATGLDFNLLELRYALTRLSGFDCSLRDALVGLRGARDEYVFSVQRVTRALVTKIEKFDGCDDEVSHALADLMRFAPEEDRAAISGAPLGVWTTRLAARWHRALQETEAGTGLKGLVEARSAARQDLIAEMRFLAAETMAA